MKTICGVVDQIFWVAEYDEFTVRTIVKINAYNGGGDFTLEVENLLKKYKWKCEKIGTGTPVECVTDIIANKRINAFLTPEKQDELLNLFKK